jgi:ribosomal protein L12E/L44/L45/RPP1/RPP2
MKEWFTQQLEDLRYNISKDILKNFKEKITETAAGAPETPKSKSKKKKGTKQPVTRKRKREEVTSLSSGGSSSGG